MSIFQKNVIAPEVALVQSLIPQEKRFIPASTETDDCNRVKGDVISID